jgi:hypothetical protein
MDDAPASGIHHGCLDQWQLALVVTTIQTHRTPISVALVVTTITIQTHRIPISLYSGGDFERLTVGVRLANKACGPMFSSASAIPDERGGRRGAERGARPRLPMSFAVDDVVCVCCPAALFAGCKPCVRRLFGGSSTSDFRCDSGQRGTNAYGRDRRATQRRG